MFHKASAMAAGIIPLSVVAFPAVLAVAIAQVPERAAAAPGCPPFEPAPRSMGVTTRYISGSQDRSYSALDPARVEAQKSIRARIDRPLVMIVNFADVYWRDPTQVNRVEPCLVNFFERMASGRALEDAKSDADFYYSDWNIAALSIAYLKARPLLERSPNSDMIKSWFERNAEQLLAFHERQRQTGKVNNHLYWGGLAVSAAGLVSGNKKHVAYGRYVLDLGIENIDERGLLAAELARGARSRHYHLFAASPLAALIVTTRAELSPRQNEKFQQLIRAVVESLDDPKGDIIGALAGPQLSETRWSDVILLQSFVSNDAPLLSKMERLTRGKNPRQLFLGGDLSFLSYSYRIKRSK